MQETTTTNTNENFDFREWVKTKKISWSFLSAFEYNPEEWYKRYILKAPFVETPEIRFGSKVGKQLEKDPEFLPMIPRQTTMEYKFEVDYNSPELGQLTLIGFADSFCEVALLLEEYKTGAAAWNQKRADEHGQIDMYLLMHYLKTGTDPEDIGVRIHWMPTKRKENGDFTVDITFVEPIEKHIKTFTTKRTKKQVLMFGARINRLLREMEEYCKAKNENK